MCKTAPVALATFILVVLTAGAAGGQIFTPNQPKSMGPIIIVDAAAFATPGSDSVRLEFYYQIYNFGLQFKEQDGDWVAAYELSVSVLDEDEVQVGFQERAREIRVASNDRTKSKFDHRTSQVNFMVLPGKYKINVNLRDKSNDATTERQSKITIESPDRDLPLLSGIEFAQAVNQTGDTGSLFTKGELAVVPSVSRAFGGDGDSRLVYYFEIYRGSDSTEKVVVESIIRHQSKGMIYRDTVHFDFNGPVLRQLREIDIKEFAPGTYELEITLRGRRNKELDQTRQEFVVLWTQDGLLKHDWKTALDQLSYVANPGELDSVKRLTSFEDRRRAFDAFWASKDPTLGTPENEVKKEFYRRIIIANQNFGYMRRDGWRTDRGRILVMHGEPDQIDDVPYSASDLPYQIWHYYRDGRYRRFTFVDENQDGDYRLEYPFDGLNQRPDF